MRRLIAVLTVVLVLSVVVGNAWGVVPYTVTDLGVDLCGARAISNTGIIVGSRGSSGFVYRDGVLLDLSTIPGGKYTDAFDVNDSGQVVGNLGVGGSSHAFLYSGGAIRDLGTLGGSQSFAYGINKSGQVVGTADTATRWHPFVYSNGVMRNLGTLPGGDYCEGYAINDKAEAVGSSTPNGHGFLYNYSTWLMRDIGELYPSGGLRPTCINNSGQIVGYGADSGGQHWRSFLYSDGEMRDIGAVPGTVDPQATAVNDSGVVVGWANIDNDFFIPRPFLYADGAIRDLNDLIAPSSGVTLTRALDINNRGQILCQGKVAGEEHGFLLTPVPEPSTFVLLGMGAVGLLGYAWRRRKRTA